MKNLLILIIVVTGIMIVGTYLRPDETKVVQEQAKLQLQTLTKGAVESIQTDAVSDELAMTEEVGIADLHSSNNEQINGSLDHETASDYTKNDLSNIGGELPVPPVDEVISPTNEVTTASVQNFKHKDQYTNGDVLEATRRNEERFQQLFDKYNLD
ncbi:MAG: hypothetical protein JAZ15_03105 [Candidatus Thiodiazotropha endolucinida]|nr:hypothetical protein [Candidatus Thiodiazotropha taylori]MCW4311983.1 hypothetical protein [Candidatus Thiodiazotropha taylori]